MNRLRAEKERKNEEQRMLRKIDCIMIRVDDVEVAAAWRQGRCRISTSAE